MGLAIERSEFSEDEFVEAGRRLRGNLTALEQLLQRPGFGQGAFSLGAEMEMSMVDDAAQALPLNRQVLAETVDPNLQLELDRFNLEYNLSPVPAAGAPFSAMRRELEQALSMLGETVAHHGGRIVPVGILPTLTEGQLQADAMTDLPRYQALAAGVKRIRRERINIQINGPEPLVAEFDTVSAEGANTSFQIHLRVNPEDFADYYNAAQLATPLALAVGANSPLLLGHRLWDETRIALFKQAVDTRGSNDHEWRRAARVPFGHGWVREGAFELFAEACHLFPIIIPIYSDENPLKVVEQGGIPELAELRLHQGTIWNWNRPVYDASAGGHLRIELRALPSGPTPLDMMANAAFALGLTAGLQPRIRELMTAFPFRYAEYNFYRAAQHGLDAKLLWPDLDQLSPATLRADELCRNLLDTADQGLDRLGVDADERRPLLQLIRDRLDSGITPARWQRRTFEQSQQPYQDEALAELVEQYLAKVATGKPVTEW